ncbi:MAG: transglycosylase family protein [Actinomycetota bacterium]|nr:transglycosylase family protein [Actinomycetota bacterium]
MHKRWRQIVVPALLGLAVIAVIGASINDSRQSASRSAVPPIGRITTDEPLPDLSEAGFRLGNLAVSLVGQLFSGTQAAMNVHDSDVTSTSVVRENPAVTSTSVVVVASTSVVRENPVVTSTSVVVAASTSVVRESPVVTSTSVVPTTTVAASLVPTTTAAILLPISEQPEHESVEPHVRSAIFGQPYLDTWPTLDMWDRVAWCESRRTWDVDTGNGYFGGLQFALGSWQWMGGTGNPADASKEEQIYRANLLWQAQGWNGWPGCKKYFGWTRWQVRQ